MGREASPHSRLTPWMRRNITRINFYRFCQLLEKNGGVAAEDNGTDADSLTARRPLKLGSTASPAHDPVRFRPWPGMGFPASELRAIEHDEDNAGGPPTVRTTFLGLYGVDSPLPSGYPDDIARRREGHEALTHFLDIFNHRVMTQFYRIWRKYSYPATFEAGGTDPTSQCLLGLMGMGIPGTQKHIATPASRFLSLSGIMRQPGRTAEGVQALVRQLTQHTRAVVTPHCPRRVTVARPARLSCRDPACLDGRAIMGDTAVDVNSQLLIALHTDSEQDAQRWLPGGELYADFQVMLRVYLGWRYRARITLTVPARLLPAARLGDNRLRAGLTAVLGLRADRSPPGMAQYHTVTLGRYQGLAPATEQKGNKRVTYRF
ncbi:MULTISPECIES: type VI secretion system baseplate subunit TssG [Tenebrionibacter/Tenebrionicola group]|jgi:type VI secretion system protein ImpH|uniref:Type VI secretion system baseplate subunit TssG n=2 Tax=Tenebrionibacter/Tenebrionicola group TaxID=2969848 RepID=A0A8K0V030_9ENTR|nr:MULTISPECIES: type VI secretion system baseplate subunit TssG [Tenebrionibacter/Tenebrionicola group]MBK4714188.1 type VI secretion system baseplate subunit TssG [Tenebrionibacter intestinalis]MBV4413283.1 type VI secretion system baseplate subunit TssG [Tenebrionicola larvae]MBV5094225.1 type VI secretion system baseplate subunit TssG [Tenebrionicola larvae]